MAGAPAPIACSAPVRNEVRFTAEFRRQGSSAGGRRGREPGGRNGTWKLDVSRRQSGIALLLDITLSAGEGLVSQACGAAATAIRSNAIPPSSRINCARAGSHRPCA